MFLPGFAGGCDFPAERVSARIIFERRLDRIAFGAVARTNRCFKAFELGAGAPMIVQGP
jgi:hypothetical protein